MFVLVRNRRKGNVDIGQYRILPENKVDFSKYIVVEVFEYYSAAQQRAEELQAQSTCKLSDIVRKVRYNER